MGLSVATEIDLIRSNYARVLRSLDKGDESVGQYKQLHGLEKNLLHLCGLGLALFKAGEFLINFVLLLIINCFFPFQMLYDAHSNFIFD